MNGVSRLLVGLFLLAGTSAQETTKNETRDSNAVQKETIATTTTVSPLPGLCATCNCTGQVIDCRDKGLQDHFKDVQWPNATYTDVLFDRNSLVRVSPFPRLSIVRLILRRNQITKIENCAFKELKQLAELDLSHNQLTSEQLQPHAFQGGFSPEAYEPLAKLNVLNLGHNVLHSLHQSLFEHLTSLKVLSLAGNPFTVIDSRTEIAISSLMYLEQLDISYCGLKSIPSPQFSTLKHLATLNLTGNQLQVVPTAFEEASTLERLYLDENPIERIAYPHVFPAMPKLKVLSLCSMPRLTTVADGSFSKLTVLEQLRVSDCPRLNEISENALVEKTTEEVSVVWPPLKKLDLSDNALRYLPMRLFGRWDWLEELNLTRNKWSCDCDNQYLVNSLLPNYGAKLMGEDADRLKCSGPPEHEGENLSKLAHRKLRCLDLYGAQPEKDAAILIGVLIGLLLAIPVGLALFILWRRGFFFCGAQGPASFSRAFYKRAANDEDL